MSGKAPKQLTASELRRAKVRLRALEQPRRVAKIYGLATAEQLFTQLGDDWPAIRDYRAEQRAGEVRKCSAAGPASDAGCKGRR
jgi:hypothetical protein